MVIDGIMRLWNLLFELFFTIAEKSSDLLMEIYEKLSGRWCVVNGQTFPLTNVYILVGHIMLRVVFNQFIFKNNIISSFSKNIISRVYSGILSLVQVMID